METIGKFLVEHKPVIRFVLASYFIVMGTLGVRSLLVGTKERYKEFTEKSRAFKFGVYFRESLFSLSGVILGAIILRRVSWAKIFAIVLLVSSTMYSARGFAWAFAKGNPSGQLFLLTLAGFCLWNGFLLYLIYMVL